MDRDPQRNFILGDQWLYYKIYTGQKTSDHVLTEIIRPVASSLIKDKVIDKWFFIRYSHPKHHLRVRFHYNDPNNISAIVNRLLPYFRDLMEQDLVWKIETDTYQRELERYGGGTMDMAEELFFYDSQMIVEFLNMIEGEEGEELRWLFGLRAMDSFLDSFAFTEEGKLALLERLKTGFGEEFGMTRMVKKQLDDSYRKEREKIDGFMVFQAEDNPEYAPILEILNTKRYHTKTIAEKIVKQQQEGTLEVVFHDLMASYIHMLMNRLFKSKNRLHEMVSYDFLYRYYRSAIARKKKRKEKHSKKNEMK